MKILFITDNFPPEFNAPATRTYEHCKEWAAQGAEITVLTGVPNFPGGKVFKGYRNKFYQEEWMGPIRVIRVWSFIARNEGFVKRIFDFISFGISSTIAGLFIKCDLIIATSPQIFAAVSGRLLSTLKRKPWVMEVRDLWPESIVAVGAMSGQSFAYRRLAWMEKSLYRHARKIAVVTDSFKSNLVDKGIEPEKIVVIKNGVDTSQYFPMARNEELASKLGLKDKFIIGYIGTHGMAHGLEFILRSILKVEDENIHFLFIGDGAERGNLVRLKDSLKLANVTMLESVPKEEVISYLSIIDVALVNLKKSDTFKNVIPSKVFENAAMEIPVLFGVDGEIRELIEQYDAGLYFEPENENEFLQAIQHIRVKHKYEAYKTGARKLADDFKRGMLARKMYHELSTILLKKNKLNPHPEIKKIKQT